MIIALIIVLGAIVLLDSAKRSRQETARRLGNAEFFMRKTNARREARYIQEALDGGYDLDDAIEAANQKLISDGFVPCIPRSQIKLQEGGKAKLYTGNTIVDDSYEEELRTLGLGENPDKYAYFHNHDSECVRTIRSILLEEGKDPTEQAVYEMFPKTMYQYDHLCRVSGAWHMLGAVGTTFTIPFDGTCEVVERMVCYELPAYRAKRLSDGMIIKVKAEDKTLRYVQFKKHDPKSKAEREYEAKRAELCKLDPYPGKCNRLSTEEVLKRLKYGWNYKE